MMNTLEDEKIDIIAAAMMNDHIFDALRSPNCIFSESKRNPNLKKTGNDPTQVLILANNDNFLSDQCSISSHYFLTMIVEKIEGSTIIVFAASHMWFHAIFR